MLQAVCAEDVGATSGHDASEMWNEVAVHIRRNPFNDALCVALGSSVVTTKVSHDKAHFHSNVDMTDEECLWLVVIDICLGGPIWVYNFDPLGFVVHKVEHGSMEKVEWWVGSE